MSRLSQVIEKLPKYNIDLEVLLELTLAAMDADVKIVDLQKEIERLKKEVERLKEVKNPEEPL